MRRKTTAAFARRPTIATSCDPEPSSFRACSRRWRPIAKLRSSPSSWGACVRMGYPRAAQTPLGRRPLEDGDRHAARHQSSARVLPHRHRSAGSRSLTVGGAAEPRTGDHQVDTVSRNHHRTVGHVPRALSESPVRRVSRRGVSGRHHAAARLCAARAAASGARATRALRNATRAPGATRLRRLPLPLGASAPR